MDGINLEKLQEICQAPIEWFEQFGQVYDTPDGIFIHKDNHSNVLGVCHLDTVQTKSHFRVREKKSTVFCPQVDDRVGAYVLLEMLPKLGVTLDWLLTIGEEKGNSTAAHFETEKKYNWMAEPDRNGEDVVLYRYEDPKWKKVVESFGFKVGNGSFSDISVLQDLGCKGMNFGVGYADAHSISAHVRTDILNRQVLKFKAMWEANKDIHFPHTKTEVTTYYGHQDNYWNEDWNKRQREAQTTATFQMDYDPEVEINMEGTRAYIPLSVLAQAVPYPYDVKQFLITGKYAGKIDKKLILSYLAQQMLQSADDEAEMKAFIEKNGLLAWQQKEKHETVAN